MRYLITLTPLEPFFFGGDVTFGKQGDKENGTYLVRSRHFPQQTALLGMIRKEMLIQAGLLTRKVRGEWVDGDEKSKSSKKNKAKEFIGETKFAFDTKQDFGDLKSISPIFLVRKRDGKRFIKKVDIDDFIYQDGLLQGYNPKVDIYDKFICIDDGKEKLSSSDIFRPKEQIGIKKSISQTDKENSYFKKTSYSLKGKPKEDEFKFALHIESDYELRDSFVTLGGEQSSFKMQVEECSDDKLEYRDKNGYLTLLSDAYIDIPIKENCKFAITSEISFNYLQNSFEGNQKRFMKSPQTRFLYEKGSVFIEPSDELIDNLNNSNLRKIGYNIFTQGAKR